MKYSEAIEYLYALRRHGIHLRLAETRHLLSLLEDPQKDFKSIHVGGTNGKGSVCAMTESILREAGYSVGLYTSPHLNDFTDRIRANGENIPREKLAQLVTDVVPCVLAMENNPSIEKPSFFEVLTALALKYFAEEGVDYAVLEVGLGGRLDSTNVVEPVVSVITNVELDHLRFLGGTLKEISGEKAGIIKDKVPVVTAEKKEEVLEILKESCKKKNTTLYRIGVEITHEKKPDGSSTIHSLRGTYQNLRIPLLGEFQNQNAACALAACELALEKKLKPDAVQKGLAKTLWPGRLELIETKPAIILDCAHNPSGTRALVRSIKKLFEYGRLFVVFGVSKYKDVDGIIAVLAGEADKLFLTESTHPLATDTQILEEKIRKYGKEYEAAGSISDAIQKARSQACEDDIIAITGSIFLVADARKIIL